MPRIAHASQGPQEGGRTEASGQVVFRGHGWVRLRTLLAYQRPEESQALETPRGQIGEIILIFSSRNPLYLGNRERTGNMTLYGARILAIRRSRSQIEQNARNAVPSKLDLLEQKARGAFKNITAVPVSPRSLIQAR